MDPCKSPVSNLIADVLLRVGAVKVSVAKPFKLTSGKLSPVYFDCRRLISHSAAMTLIAGSFQWILEQCGITLDVVAGGESAGIPFADRLSATLGKPLVYVRKETRTHGTGSGIEGDAPAGARVLLVEDLITDGRSKMIFINGLRQANLVVEHCLVVLDREQGGSALLAQEGVTLHSLTTAANVLDYGVQSGYLAKADVAAVIAYLENPDAWQSNRPAE